MTRALLTVAFLLRAAAVVAQGVDGQVRSMTVTQATGTNLHMVCDSGCAGAADATASATLDANNETLDLAVSGYQGAGLWLAAGTFDGILAFYASHDGGATYVAKTVLVDGTDQVASKILTSPQNAFFANWYMQSNFTHIRVKVSSYTSGAAVATLRATAIPDQLTAIRNAVAENSPSPATVAVVAGEDSGGTARIPWVLQSNPTSTAWGHVVRPFPPIKVAMNANPANGGTVGVTSATLVASNDNRTGLVIVNLSANTVCFSLIASAAVLNTGICLQSGGSWTMTQDTFVTGAIRAIASGAGSTVSFQEFTW